MQARLGCCRTAGLFSKDLYLQSQAYSIDKWWFGLYHGIYSLAETLAVLWFGVLPWAWQQLPKVAPAAVAKFLDNEILHTIAFVLVISLVGTITQLPWSLYSTFVIEERHGFNKQTLGKQQQTQEQQLHASQQSFVTALIAASKRDHSGVDALGRTSCYGYIRQHCLGHWQCSCISG
eukprot:GHUV01042692.1.p1 GENE.GHUV01042692.1~~GHUV01042692.1.p1  ORF type:complete len:177 (-),score=28.07 GHUV01042692.1:321-851(-)